VRETHSKNDNERLRDTKRERDSTIEIEKDLERVIDREGKIDGTREGLFSPSFSFTIYSYTFSIYFLCEVIFSSTSIPN